MRRVKTEGRLKARIVAGVVLVVIACAFLIYAAMACWAFRDGMGPDAITSHGAMAFSRFWEDFWSALIIAIAVCSVGVWLAWPYFRRQKPAGRSS